MNRKFYLLMGIFVVVLLLGFFVNQNFDNKGNIKNSPTPVAKTPATSSSPKIQSTDSPAPSPAPEIPDSYLIDGFSFQSQAPDANWDQLHDEACEEASLILVNYYLKNQPVSAALMEEQIQKMVSWEIDNFGSHKDLTIAETAQMAKGYYNLSNFKIENNITIEDIKREISQNHPIIVPTAGRLLGNPNFRSPGPIYHMVVVIGYEDNTIIVQDVGTRNGDHYHYSQNILYNAIHDWNGSPENIEDGKKTMLVFS